MLSFNYTRIVWGKKKSYFLTIISVVLHITKIFLLAIRPRLYQNVWINVTKFTNSCQLKPDDLLKIKINENKSKGIPTDLFRLAETVAQVSFCTCCGGTFQMSQANKSAIIQAEEGSAPHVCFTMKVSPTRNQLWFCHRLLLESLQLRHGSRELWKNVSGLRSSLFLCQSHDRSWDKRFGSQQELSCSSIRF